MIVNELHIAIAVFKIKKGPIYERLLFMRYPFPY